ncbi:MAG: FecR domain-containing protein [Deltaproteobacteria bacterium]|nr:FecR domain-containing protein [Deltaproteobacteria bacterium]
MKRSKKGWLIQMVLLVLLVNGFAFAGDEPFDLEIEGVEAKVNLLQGKADVQRAKEEISNPLSEGDVVSHGDTVKTHSGSRIELLLADGSFTRFDEETSFRIQSLEVDTKAEERDIKLKLLAGKTWAKVKSFTGAKNNFEMYTASAVAGIRGTTYRINEDPSQGTLVRVYEGEIKVWSAPREVGGPGQVGAPGIASGAPGQVAAPKPAGAPREVAGPESVSKPGTVGGPGAVAGPGEVSMMEWVYLVRAMQQITITPDGRPTRPRTFTEAEDKNDWVLWNQERDRLADR